MKIAISEVKINSGRRETSLNGVDELAKSISEGWSAEPHHS